MKLAISKNFCGLLLIFLVGRLLSSMISPFQSLDEFYPVKRADLLGNVKFILDPTKNLSGRMAGVFHV